MLVSAIGKLNTFGKGCIKPKNTPCSDKKCVKNVSEADTFVKFSAKDK